MVIWRFIDARAGHDQQTLGLLRALQSMMDVDVFELHIKHLQCQPWHWLRRQFVAGENLPAPDILLGAGHATHWPMLVAQRSWQGRTVVLMKPSLPVSWFDLCVIPEHDRPADRMNIFVTQGVLNATRSQGLHASDRSLILLGGIAHKFAWDSQAMQAQIQQLLNDRPEQQWSVVVSPRTPADMLDRLAEMQSLAVLETATHELAQLMPDFGEIFVSEDSVSMVYEALSSGAAVGLLAVPRKCSGRVSRGVDMLVRRRAVFAPGSLQSLPLQPPLNEALRCAQWIRKHWVI